MNKNEEYMYDQISPKYLLKLTALVHDAIWKEFGSYKNVLFYLKKWYKYEHGDWGEWENFAMQYKESGDIDLLATLHNIDGETLIKVAIDIGVETPDFIPSIPTFKNEIKAGHKNVHETLVRAHKIIEEDPSTSIGLANSALEGILKEILKDERLNAKIKGKETLYQLATIILKEFNLLNSEMPKEIKTIGTSLLSASQAIENLRSKKTNFHGKTDDDSLVKDSIYAYFVVNTVSTIGMFLNSFYKSRFPINEPELDVEDDELPF